MRPSLFISILLLAIRAHANFSTKYCFIKTNLSANQISLENTLKLRSSIECAAFCSATKNDCDGYSFLGTNGNCQLIKVNSDQAWSSEVEQSPYLLKEGVLTSKNLTVTTTTTATDQCNSPSILEESVSTPDHKAINVFEDCNGQSSKGYWESSDPNPHFTVDFGCSAVIKKVKVRNYFGEKNSNSIVGSKSIKVSLYPVGANVTTDQPLKALSFDLANNTNGTGCQVPIEELSLGASYNVQYIKIDVEATFGTSAVLQYLSWE